MISFNITENLRKKIWCPIVKLSHFIFFKIIFSHAFLTEYGNHSLTQASLPGPADALLHT